VQRRAGMTENSEAKAEHALRSWGMVWYGIVGFNVPLDTL